MEIYLEKKASIKLKKGRSIKKTILFLLTEKPTTYFDKGCLRKQCSKDKSRSFSELYWIVKTIFPSTSCKRYATVLRKVLEENKLAHLVFCLSVNKVTVCNSFINVDYGLNRLMIPNILFNYNIVNNFYTINKGVYCAHDILVLMGYTKEEINNLKKKFNIKEKEEKEKV